MIGNAIKFTEEGGIYVEVKGTPAPEGKHLLIITVKDTGIGISAETQQRIFDAFTQADNSISRNYGGTGLGLSISARLVGLMGGTMKVGSMPGKGSKFTIELELAGAQVTTKHAKPATSSDGSRHAHLPYSP